MTHRRGLLAGWQWLAVAAVAGVASIGLARYDSSPMLAAVAPTAGCPKYVRTKAFGTVPSAKAKRATIAAATDSSGNVVDWYTGDILIATPDVDHVYPLDKAWSALCHRTKTVRKAFANDLTNLVATSAHVNRAKGALTPAEWSPIDRGHACAYGQKWLAVAKTWQLPTPDLDAMAVTMACAT